MEFFKETIHRYISLDALEDCGGGEEGRGK